jgi:hypothetical protein
VGDPVAADRAPGDEQPADALRHCRPVGHVHVAARGREDEHAVAVDELGVDADRVREPRLAADVGLGEVVGTSILRVSRMPIVIPRLRSRTPSQPGV